MKTIGKKINNCLMRVIVIIGQQVCANDRYYIAVNNLLDEFIPQWLILVNCWYSSSFTKQISKRDSYFLIQFFHISYTPNSIYIESKVYIFLSVNNVNIDIMQKVLQRLSVDRTLRTFLYIPLIHYGFLCR